MKKNRSLPSRRGARIAPWLASLGLVSCPAWAETSPYYVGVNQAFSRDSNIFRAPNGQPATSDVWSTTGLIAGVDQPIGRQRFYANGTLRHNRYQDLRDLDNTDHTLKTGLDWATVERLSGSVTYVLNETLAQYAADAALQLTKKNIERSQQFAATARLGVVTRMTLEGTVQHRSVDYSAVEYDYRDSRQDAVGLGVKYTAGGELTVGSGLRYTKGSYPRFQQDPISGAFVSDDFDRKDLDLTANWTPTGLSTINARLSFSRQTDSVARDRDFSGATGALTWDYRPTGKLHFTLLLSRDTGAEVSYYNISSGTVFGVGDNSRLSTTLQLGAVYDVTAKIQLNARASQTHRSLVDVITLAGTGLSSGVTGSDTTTLLSLGARYAPSRNWLLACNVGRDARTSSSTLSYAYGANTASCSAQFVLQ